MANIGAGGRALTRLRPTGKVVLDADPAAEFEARSDGGEISRDGRIRVVGAMDDGRLVVAPEAVGPESKENLSV